MKLKVSKGHSYHTRGKKHINISIYTSQSTCISATLCREQKPRKSWFLLLRTMARTQCSLKCLGSLGHLGFRNSQQELPSDGKKNPRAVHSSHPPTSKKANKNCFWNFMIKSFRDRSHFSKHFNVSSDSFNLMSELTLLWVHTHTTKYWLFT